MTEDENKTGVNQLEAGSIGQWLCSARKLKGLEISDVSSHLRLPEKIIEAIESENFSTLGPIAFIRGYLRSYARFLELRDDVIIETFNQLDFKSLDTSSGVSVKLSQRRRVKMPMSQRTSRWVTVLIATALLLLTISWWYQRSAPITNKTVVNDILTVPPETASVAKTDLITTPQPPAKQPTVKKSAPAPTVVAKQTVPTVEAKQIAATQADKLALAVPFT